MSLINMFNFNFIKENLKKSKAIILLCILFIPIVNAIIYLFQTSNSNVFIPSIYEASPLSLMGLYLMPIILSITLFSFQYKRSSSDFVMSLPISKKQVFLSNTLIGILLLILSNVINYIILLIISLLFSNLVLDYSMLFDIFIMWTISYIFMFVCTNVAASISSNKITTVVVTLLIIFLIPFFHSFVKLNSENYTVSNVDVICKDESCKPINYECYNTLCTSKLNKNIYSNTNISKISNIKYTLPYGFFYSFLFSNSSNYNYDYSFIKMIILSILYSIIGLILYNKRKFEIVETSFKNEKVHLVIKSLTTIPIICIFYIILKESDIQIFLPLLFIVLSISYLIIYDLLTRKKVVNVFKSIIYFSALCLIVVIILELPQKKNYTISANDINKISFENVEFDSYNTKNKDVINYVISKAIDNNISSSSITYVDVIFYDNSNSYKVEISLDENDYNKLLDIIEKDKTKKINKKNIYGIYVNDSFLIDVNSNIGKKIINDSSKNNKSYNSLFKTSLLIYNNRETSLVNIYIDDIDVMKYIVNSYNNITFNYFNNIDSDITSYYYDDYHYIDAYGDGIQKLNDFIIKNCDENVDVSKEYGYLNFYTENNKTYTFVTNRVKELNAILSDFNDTSAYYEDGDIDEEFTY